MSVLSKVSFGAVRQMQNTLLTEVEGQCVVVRTEGKEEEQRREPDANTKECSYICESGGIRHLARSVGQPCLESCVLGHASEVEEPQEVVDDDHGARCEECDRCQRH